MNNGTHAHTDDEPSPWTQPRFLAAAIAVGMIVVLGIVLAFTGDRSGGAQSPSAAPPIAAPPAQAAPSDTDSSVCGLPAGSQRIPNTPPKATWKLRGTVAVPVSAKTFGPAQDTNGVPACFAHSPTGALFAMLNIQAAMGQLAQQEGRYPIARVLRMIAQGPGRETLKRAVARQPVATQGTRTPGAQVAGFNIVRYEPDTAVIDVAFAGGRPGAAGYVHGQSTMRWQDGDWKLVLAQNGGPFDSVQPIGDLANYIAWRGV